MAKSFAITTTATETLRADAKGHAEAGFTVTNTTSRPIRGLAKARPLGDTKREWLSVQGEVERDFAAGATQQFTVSFDGPATEPATATSTGTPAAATGTAPAPAARKYPFRLDVATALNPDEDFTEGPTVTVEIAATPVTPKNGKFPLWIIFVILGVLLLVGIIVLVVVLTRDKPKNNNQEPEETPSPVVSPKPATRFEGKWTNADPNTGGITRLLIEQNRSQLSVHPFGKCHPQDCDWGTEKGSVIGNEGHVTFDQGFAMIRIVLALQGDQLKASVDTVFNDTRPRQHHDYVFNRQP